MHPLLKKIAKEMVQMICYIYRMMIVHKIYQHPSLLQSASLDLTGDDFASAQHALAAGTLSQGTLVYFWHVWL